MGLVSSRHECAHRKIVGVINPEILSEQLQLFDGIFLELDDGTALLVEFEQSYAPENIFKYVDHIMGYKDDYLKVFPQYTEEYQDIPLLFILLLMGKTRETDENILEDTSIHLIGETLFLDSIDIDARIAELREKYISLGPALKNSRLIFIDFFHLIVMGLARPKYNAKVLMTCVELVKNTSVPGFDERVKLDFFEMVASLYNACVTKDEMAELLKDATLKAAYKRACKKGLIYVH
jgi:hypothetical protein